MKIHFLGTGEACDERNYNNSFVINNESKVLVDCGYSIPMQFWNYEKDPNFLDYIYISHTHADHFFGLPALILRLNEDKRSKPLSILCPKSFAGNIKELCSLGYPGLLEKINFTLEFIEVEEGQKLSLGEYQLNFAETQHSMKNLAVSFQLENVKISYSGDGKYTQSSSKLFQNSDLLIHDSYSFHKTENHGEISEIVELADKSKIQKLALTHIQRNTRYSSSFTKKIKDLQDNHPSLTIIIPKSGDQIAL
jgi:ribonuclease BN (tRNA processing enzyme)